MAVTPLIGLPSGAIFYNTLTDSPTDWASVSNDTYFYDKTTRLAYYKNVTGDILHIFSNSSTPITVDDEGVPLTTNVNEFDFVGELVQATAVGDKVTIDVNQYDSGWIDMPAYDNIKGYGFTPNALYPKIRVIGRQVHVQGVISMPLADNLGNLYPDYGTYPNIASNILYQNTTDGYKVNANGTFRTEKPIVPTELCPEIATFILPDIALVKRTIKLGDNTTKYPMVMPLYTSSIGTTGLLNFAGLKYIESDQVTFDYPLSNLHEFVSKFKKFDKPIDYSVSYYNSYTGGVIQQIPTELATVGASFLIDFDPRDASQYGGFVVLLSTSWLIAKTTPMADIINAVNNL